MLRRETHVAGRDPCCGARPLLRRETHVAGRDPCCGARPLLRRENHVQAVGLVRDRWSRRWAVDADAWSGELHLSVRDPCAGGGFRAGSVVSRFTGAEAPWPNAGGSAVARRRMPGPDLPFGARPMCRRWVSCENRGLAVQPGRDADAGPQPGRSEAAAGPWRGRGGLRRGCSGPWPEAAGRMRRVAAGRPRDHGGGCCSEACIPWRDPCAGHGFRAESAVSRRNPQPCGSTRRCMTLNIT